MALRAGSIPAASPMQDVFIHVLACFAIVVIIERLTEE